MPYRTSRGRVLGAVVSSVRALAAAGTATEPGTYTLSNSTGDLQTLVNLGTPAAGLQWEFIVNTFTTSTAGANVKLKAPAGVTILDGVGDKDVAIFDAVGEALVLRGLSATQYGIVANTGSVTLSSST